MGECGPVAALKARAQVLKELDERLRQTLPPPLRGQVRLADLRDGRIVFLAPSPAWASKLRMLQNEILANARSFGAHAGSVVVKVAPPPPEPKEPEPAKPLSHTAAHHLRSAARFLSDPELRALFLELASFAEHSSSPRGSE